MGFPRVPFFISILNKRNSNNRSCTLSEKFGLNLAGFGLFSETIDSLR
jgi:hypothetical protein